MTKLFRARLLRALFLACAFAPASALADPLTNDPTRPVQRIDPNSTKAHQQLVQKAQHGKIDVFFLGDSITRRWGAADPQYKPLLQNWN